MKRTSRLVAAIVPGTDRIIGTYCTLGLSDYDVAGYSAQISLRQYTHGLHHHETCTDVHLPPPPYLYQSSRPQYTKKEWTEHYVQTGWRWPVITMMSHISSGRQSSLEGSHAPHPLTVYVLHHRDATRSQHKSPVPSRGTPRIHISVHHSFPHTMPAP